MKPIRAENFIIDKTYYVNEDGTGAITIIRKLSQNGNRGFIELTYTYKGLAGGNIESNTTVARDRLFYTDEPNFKFGR